MDPEGAIAKEAVAGERARRFRFVANPRPLAIGGTTGLVVALFLIFGISQLHGRFDGFSGWVLLAMLAAVGFSLRNTFVGAARSAAALGHVEVDSVGLRWIRPDAAPGFDLRWNELSGGTVDERNGLLLLQRVGGAPAAMVGVVDSNGNPSGFVVVEHFPELLALVRTRVPIAVHQGSGTPTTGLRTLALGAACLAEAAALQALNTALAEHFRWRNTWPLFPAFVALVGAIGVLAGARISLGKGSMVSSLHSERYPRQVLRFMAVALAGDLVLLAITNLLGP